MCVYKLLPLQAIRAARSGAIEHCQDLPNSNCLPAKRVVNFKYRTFNIPIKVTCIQEQCSLAVACAVKGAAVEVGLLKPIFAEELRGLGLRPWCHFSAIAVWVRARMWPSGL